MLFPVFPENDDYKLLPLKIHKVKYQLNATQLS